MADLLVEEIASLCLERMQDEGQQVLEEICAEHRDHADEIRGMVKQLLLLGFMENPQEDDLKQIGEYRILRRLGGGGMGVVYLALQESLGRQVALKVMRPGFGLRGKSKARFQREIEALSAIDHPGVCTIYEAGEVDGLPYLAMRYIEGESLAEILTRRRSDKRDGKTTSTSSQNEVSQLLGCAVKAALALHCAHEAGLVHRDVKPGNIMIDGNGEPVLLDFGLVQEADRDTHDLTASGDLLGTPPYMAPEQVEGKVVDRRCDVYSLAVTLYECLTLNTPFDGPNRQAIYTQVLDALPPNPRKKNRAISKDLWIVLSKAMEKDPDHRFSTTLEFAAELRRILNHEPIHSVRPNPFVRGRRWTQRNRAATTVLLTMAAGLLVSLLLLRRSQHAEERNLDLLQQSQMAESRMKALVYLGDAINIMDDDPTLAFKLAREAFRLEPKAPDARVLSRIQELMFLLRPNRTVARGMASFNEILYSRKGKFLLMTGMFQPAILCTGAGEPIDLVLPEGSSQSLPAAFSPDESELAIVDRKGKVFRYDLTKSPPAIIWESELAIYPKVGAVEYRMFPDGLRLLACSMGDHVSRPRDSNGYFIADNRATVWRLDGSDPVDVHVPSLAASFFGGWLPDGRFVMGGRIWDANGTQSLLLDGQEGEIDSTDGNSFLKAYAVGEKYFLTLTTSGHLRVYKHDGSVWWMRNFSGMGQVGSVRFDPSGTRILLSFLTGHVRLLDVPTRSLIPWDLEVHPLRTVMATAFSQDGERFSIGYWGGRVKIFDAEGGVVDVFFADVNSISSLAFSPDGQSLASGSWGSEVRLWDLGGFPGIGLFTGLVRPDIAVSPDGKTVAIVDSGAKHILTDGDGKPLYRGGGTSKGFNKGQTLVQFSPGGKRLMLSTAGGQIQFLDIESRERISVDPSPMVRLVKVTRYLDDEHVLYRQQGQNLAVWKVGTNEAPLFEPQNQVVKPYVQRVPVCSDVSGDGKLAVVGYWKGYVRVLDRSGKELWKSPGRVGMARSVRLSRDGRMVLLASEDGYVHLWDRQTGEHKKMGSHFSGVHVAIFSPDEKQIAVANKSGRIRVWDLRTGALRLDLTGHSTQVNNLIYTHSGRLVSAGNDGKVLWWWTDPEQLRNAIEALPIPELTDADRALLPQLFPPQVFPLQLKKQAPSLEASLGR